jgi:hypothetical protein
MALRWGEQRRGGSGVEKGTRSGSAGGGGVVGQGAQKAVRGALGAWPGRGWPRR